MIDEDINHQNQSEYKLRGFEEDLEERRRVVTSSLATLGVGAETGSINPNANTSALGAAYELMTPEQQQRADLFTGLTMASGVTSIQRAFLKARGAEPSE